MSIVGSILAHKFLVAIVLASMVAGGVVSNLNTVATMSFTVNSGISVTSIASMNFGNLSPGESKDFTSTATINVVTPNNYTIFLTNRGILHDIFSNFTVVITGLGQQKIVLNLEHESQTVNLPAGSYSVTITVSLTVKNNIDHTVTVQNASFLAIGLHPAAEIPPAPVKHHENEDEDDN
ncbi:MAG: hypothetical protein QXV84_05855 [Conexivisphaerales archaeon]